MGKQYVATTCCSLTDSRIVVSCCCCCCCCWWWWWWSSSVVLLGGGCCCWPHKRLCPSIRAARALPNPARNFPNPLPSCHFLHPSCAKGTVLYRGWIRSPHAKDHVHQVRKTHILPESGSTGLKSGADGDRSRVVGPTSQEIKSARQLLYYNMYN